MTKIETCELMINVNGNCNTDSRISCNKCPCLEYCEKDGISDEEVVRICKKYLKETF